MKYVLLYAPADDVAAKAPPHYEAHVARLMEFQGRGELLEVGVFGDPQEQGSMAIFASREGAEEFVREDPFLLNGVVASYEIRDWDVMPAP
jgi:uncharacterized protein